jgi:23S rRNA (cytosine1962-C5)-methyltransferase
MGENPYELLDFGQGRKLERFGTRIVDRPAPQAERAPRRPEAWLRAQARFDADRAGAVGNWIPPDLTDTTWPIDFGLFTLELRLAPQGQVGVFPEQQRNWYWIGRQIQAAGKPTPRVLNLFGYTGGSTLAAAAAGAEVTHVDSSTPSIHWARENARLSGLEEAPIRWITEDARLFVQRELRRGRQYQGIILDPPSFGRGPRGQVWKLSRDLPELLNLCQELASDQLQFFLLTFHTTGISHSAVEELARDTLGQDPHLRLQSEGLSVPCRSGGSLSSGWAIRGTMW